VSFDIGRTAAVGEVDVCLITTLASRHM